MKRFLSLLVLVGLMVTSCAQNDKKEDMAESNTDNNGQTSTYYFIRHSEKDRSDADNQDPNLTEKGRQRADNWSKELADVKFDAIYSTNYNRTKQTATPLARKNRLELKIYDPSLMNDPKFLKETKGMTVLVVGHSNTTPIFANAILGEDKYQEMDDRNNANLYIVTLKDGEATSKMRKVTL